MTEPAVPAAGYDIPTEEIVLVKQEAAPDAETGTTVA